MINRSGLFDGFDEEPLTEVMNMADAENAAKAKRLLQLRQALLDAGASAQQVDGPLVQVMTLADVDEMPPGHRIGVSAVRALDLVLNGAAHFTEASPDYAVKALAALRPAPAPPASAPQLGDQRADFKDESIEAAAPAPDAQAPPAGAPQPPPRRRAR